MVLSLEDACFPAQRLDFAFACLAKYLASLDPPEVWL